MESNITDHVRDIINDDQRGRDPNVVEELLTKEMLRLSVRDRNDIQEEIHGVRCLAVKETPELVRESLKQLTAEIDNNIPASQKRAYLQSLTVVCPENPISARDPASDSGNKPQQKDSDTEEASLRTGTTPATASTATATGSSTTASTSTTTTSTTTPTTYIHGDDFRLRFLRCDLFDVKAAARRMVIWLDMLVELFGEDALRRPIRLADFTKDELRHMRKGMIQSLPYRDRSGRRIIICFPEEEESQIPPFVKAKIVMYILWSTGYQDAISQEKGFVVLVWFDASFAELSMSWKIKYKFYTLNCDRIAALHCCSPDTSHYRFRRSIMIMRAGKEHLNKMVFHLGKSMEIHYKLQCYGIPFAHVPISWTGKVKVNYLKMWLRIRQAIEQRDNKRVGIGNSNGNGCSDGSSCDESSTISLTENIIECPQLQDVIFRQGTSGVSHPGNVTFRSFVESTVVKEQIARETRIIEQQKLKELKKKQRKQLSGNGSSGGGGSSNSTKNPKAKRPKQLALDIYEARQQTGSSHGRFLIWNNEKSWWNELTDREQICMKIEYMVREFQKNCKRSNELVLNHKLSKKNNNGMNGNGSNAGKSSMRRKDHPYGESNCHYNDDEDDDKNNNGRGNVVGGVMGPRSKKVIYLQSGTSLFQSQDGSNPFFTNKRQRLLNNNNIFGTDEGNNSIEFGRKKTECFGMKFAPCLT